MNLLVLPGSTWEILKLILGLFPQFRGKPRIFQGGLLLLENSRQTDKYVMYKTQSILRTME